jgi:hypothetical protein
MYSEKATNICEISTVDLSYVVTVKSTVKISQNFVAFSEYMNFKQNKKSRKLTIDSAGSSGLSAARIILAGKYCFRTLYYLDFLPSIQNLF